MGKKQGNTIIVQHKRVGKYESTVGTKTELQKKAYTFPSSPSLHFLSVVSRAPSVFNLTLSPFLHFKERLELQAGTDGPTAHS